MKAVLQYRASPGFIQLLKTRQPEWLSITVVEEFDKLLFHREMQDADVLLHVLEPVTAAVINHAPKLKLIQKIGVGVNTIDLDAAGQNHVAVANMPGTNSQAVVEMTLGLILAVLRRLVQLDQATRAGKGWELPLDIIDGMGELAGKTVGLVGYGEVARRLSPILQALGAEVNYCRRNASIEPEPNRRKLFDLLAQADIISLHLPLAADTENLINSDVLAAMKPGSILINTARGALIDEDALMAALTIGHVAGAGLDVMCREPAPADNPLFKLPNVVVTPHLAWLTPETLDRSLDIAFENCRRIKDGEPLLHQVLPH